MLKKLKARDNYTLWHKRSVMGMYLEEIRSFIDAGILEKDPAYFADVFKAAECACSNFYNSLKECLGVASTDEVRYNVDFRMGVYDYEIVKDVSFNARVYLLKSLNLKPEFEVRVLEVVV